jgi:hypothetical protein
MQITILGLVLVPLTLIWAMNPVRLLELAFFAAVFEAGAAAIIGSFGLPTAMVPGLLFIVFVVAQYALGMRYPAEGPVFWALTPLLALLAYALLSVLLLPDAFAGLIMVAPQKNDPLQGGFVPLAFSAGNVTQPLYLGMNVALTTTTALFLTRSAIPYQRIMGAYLLGGYVVVGLAFWQFASRVAGLPFPDTILYSNPSWTIVEQAMGSVPRIQGPFSEPAGLAFYLSGLCFCCLWLTAHGYRLMHVTWLLSFAILAMLLSTSTTGILTLVVGLPLILIFAAAGADGQALGRLGRTAAMLALGGAIALTPVVIMKPELLDMVSGVVDSTLNKGDTDSFAQRSATDTAAMDTLGTTYGLGVGWGSFRSSSLVPGLAANGGAFGLVAVVWLGLRTTQLARRRGRAVHGHPGQVVVAGFSASLCGQLTAALFSAPTIASLAFFLQLGCVIGISARLSREPRLSLEPRLSGPAGVRRANAPPASGEATAVPATTRGSFTA